MTTLAQLVRTGVALHRMDQLLFLLPHPGGSAGAASTGLLFQCVPSERRRFAGRYALDTIRPRQGSGSGKRSLSIRRGTNPRSISLRVGSHSGSADHSAAPPSLPRILLFLFWTVHGPFSLFLLEEKEKMGGALHQPSLVAIPPPARRASKSHRSAFGGFSKSNTYRS